MSTQETHVATSALSQACEAVLDANELQSSEIGADGRVAILTADGDHCFAVTPGISHIDLRTLITHGRMRYALGQAAGRDALAASFRSLIGAAPAA